MFKPCKACTSAPHCEIVYALERMETDLKTLDEKYTKLSIEITKKEAVHTMKTVGEQPIK